MGGFTQMERKRGSGKRGGPIKKIQAKYVTGALEMLDSREQQKGGG